MLLKSFSFVHTHLAALSHINDVDAAPSICNIIIQMFCLRGLCSLQNIWKSGFGVKVNAGVALNPVCVAHAELHGVPSLWRCRSLEHHPLSPLQEKDQRPLKNNNTGMACFSKCVLYVRQLFAICSVLFAAAMQMDEFSQRGTSCKQHGTFMEVFHATFAAKASPTNQKQTELVSRRSSFECPTYW